jgi:hypothetical protein
MAEYIAIGYCCFLIGLMAGRALENYKMSDSFWDGFSMRPLWRFLKKK